jgi:hypothetical protein
LASLLRDALNGVPVDANASAWLHRGAFNNGLVEPPPGGWAIEPGNERRPKLVALREQPLLGAPMVQANPEPARPSAPAAHFAFENQTPRLAP